MIDMKKSVLFFLAMICVWLADAQSQPNKYGVVVPENYISKLDVVYARESGWEGKMDLYLSAHSDKPVPVLINIHGGGWARNSKEKERGFGSLFENNVAVANMSYRLTGTATAPAAVEDVRSVLAYLIKHAQKLNIDPQRIILMGSSAGGHLALMGGYLQNNTIYDKNKRSLRNLKVAAVIDKYGVADMVAFTIGGMYYKSAVRWLGEHITDPEFIKTVSPMTYVNTNTPPTLILHGDMDDVVPYQQSVDLKTALDSCHVYNRLVTLEGAGHSGHDKATKSLMNAEIISFLKELQLIDHE